MNPTATTTTSSYSSFRTDLYKDVNTLIEERNQIKIGYTVLERETSALKQQVANFEKMEQQRQRAEEDKRKVAPA
ncbi:hypothetical protein KI688_004378 [Linnemannia hyalina]|uniref:Uncharacterized protein n=1 Tax=Linnemannia hyalina TaxID=64524 RepID=A0A9P7XP80_9FUNG|nr:hypothetical protein KI688_004378 [Linnemannia hyalina]